MRSIAERYLEAASRPAKPLPSRKELMPLYKKYLHVVIFGVLSFILYDMLYVYNSDLIQLAQETHSGHKSLFFLPVGIALLFSLVHGNFTAHFWDVLGIKAKTKS